MIPPERGYYQKQVLLQPEIPLSELSALLLHLHPCHQVLPVVVPMATIAQIGEEDLLWLKIPPVEETFPHPLDHPHYRQVRPQHHQQEDSGLHLPFLLPVSPRGHQMAFESLPLASKDQKKHQLLHTLVVRSCLFCSLCSELQQDVNPVFLIPFHDPLPLVLCPQLTQYHVAQETRIAPHSLALHWQRPQQG